MIDVLVAARHDEALDICSFELAAADASPVSYTHLTLPTKA